MNDQLDISETWGPQITSPLPPPPPPPSPQKKKKKKEKKNESWQHISYKIVLCPAKIQISLLIHAVWSESSQDNLCVAEDSKRPLADSKVS